MKVQKELDETKIVLVSDRCDYLFSLQRQTPLLGGPSCRWLTPQHKTIESVLERGEKLDNLVERSNALSQQSKLFYKTAKKVSFARSLRSPSGNLRDSDGAHVRSKTRVVSLCRIGLSLEEGQICFAYRHDVFNAPPQFVSHAHDFDFLDLFPSLRLFSISGCLLAVSIRRSAFCVLSTL